nr:MULTISPECIES: hypothetical protein [Pseudomonas]
MNDTFTYILFVKIVTFVTPGADGTLTAQSISAGKDGVTPPM